MTKLLLFPVQPATPDAEAREAALDIRRSFIVEAPAGSGKTGLLLQRLLKLLADPAVTEPGQVLAITFTVKATAELRERVLTQLDQAAAGIPVDSPFDLHTRELALAVLERDRTLHWGLRDQPQRLRIRTIDSVCAEIARSLPVLSGAGGSLSPIPDAGPLHREAARRTFMLLGTAEPELDASLRDLLLHRDGNLLECERLLAEMLAWRDQWGGLVPLDGGTAALTDAALDRDVLPRLEAALDHAICNGLNRLAHELPPDIVQELTSLAAEMGHAPGYEGADSPIAICAGQHTTPQAIAAHLEHWRALIHLLVTGSGGWRKDRGINKKNIGFEYDRKHVNHARLVAVLDQLAHRDDLLEILLRARALPPAHYPTEQWSVAKSLLRILRRALIELQLVFVERGQCDFTEQALLARAALLNDTTGDNLAAALGMRLQHLLVDEMQDTSTGQYELLERLTRGWDGYSQTIFLVGDPKQSIYRFRQARVERFLGTMQTGLLGDLPLQPLRLTANFRSRHALVEDFNHDFSRIFPQDTKDPEEVRFVNSDPAREDNAAAAGPLRHWHTHLVATKDDLSRQRREDAAEIVQRIAELRARLLPTGRTRPWSVAVLVRTRNHLAPIVAALKQTGIPYRAVEIDPLAERPEILDLLALTRALLHPADRVAWLAILRAPWCGLTLADLHRLAGSDDSALARAPILDLLKTRGELLSPDGCTRLEHLWTVMADALGQRDRLSIAPWIERTWRSLGGHRSLDAEATTNALRFFELLDELDADATFDLEELTHRLERLYAAPATHPHAVDLMTIHAAKGLEWDLVLVPALERRGQANRGHLLTWVELDTDDPAAAPILFAPIPGRGEPSRALNDWLRSIETAREAAEHKRLFYVAATRAREELHLFATLVPTKGNTFAPEADTLLRAAWPAAEQAFSTTTVQPATTFALAASDDEAPSGPPMLYRLPLSTLAAHTTSPALRRSTAADTAAQFQPFLRPEGSFAARALGNAIHIFLEHLANRIAAGEPTAALTATLPQWKPRIAAVLRSLSLAPAIVERGTRKVQLALQNILGDPIGQWVLAAHLDAASERSLTAVEPRALGIRLDRIFRAGPEPLAPGDTHLWVVDFKTATHGQGDNQEFLARERKLYEPQLHTYVTVLRAVHPGIPLRTMLFYPLLPAHSWWEPGP